MKEPPTIYPDAQLENADWTKAEWDLGACPDAARFRIWLAWRGMTVAAFKRLPVYKWNVDKLPWLADL